MREEEGEEWWMEGSGKGSDISGRAKDAASAFLTAILPLILPHRCRFFNHRAPALMFYQGVEKRFALPGFV